MGVRVCEAMAKRNVNGSTYLTVEEVAERFGVNPTTIYRLAQAGKLPGIKVGKQWRFSVARLDEWAADRERLG